MAEALSFKEEASRMVERAATEIEMFFLLSSILLALDAFLVRFDDQHRPLLKFDWTFAHGFNIGAILSFFVLFSLTTTLLSPLLIYVIRFLTIVPWWTSFPLLLVAIPLAWNIPITLWQCTVIMVALLPCWRFVAPWLRSEGDHSDGTSSAYVRMSELREFALSSKENFYLLDLINSEDRKYAKAERESNKLGMLAFSSVLIAMINYTVGYSTHATIAWNLLSSNVIGNPEFQNLIAIVAMSVCFVIVASIKPVFMFSQRSNQDIYCPLLARKKMEERRLSCERSASKASARFDPSRPQPAPPRSEDPVPPRSVHPPKPTIADPGDRKRHRVDRERD
jgi:hypothetical protein